MFLKTGSLPLIFRYRFATKILEGLFEVEQAALSADRLVVTVAAFPSEDCAEVNFYL